MTCREESRGFGPIKIGVTVGEITESIPRLRVLGPTNSSLSITVSSRFYVDGHRFWIVDLHEVVVTCREESDRFGPIKIGGPVGEITQSILRLLVPGPANSSLSNTVSSCF